MEFDPLRSLVDLAHSNGLHVHAWVNMYLTWSEDEPHPSPKHVINRRPDWITADRDGVRLDKLSRDQLRARSIEGLYLSPAIPEVRQYLAGVAFEIARRYDVDGVHLDYVRYPGKGAGLDEYSRARFAGAYGFDPIGFLSESSGEKTPADTFWANDLVSLWNDWRAEQVTSLVASISRRVRSWRPEVMISAAVRPDPAAAAEDYGQDWAGWLKAGYVDFVAPMIYTSSTTKFFGAVGRLREAVPDSLEGRVLAGVSLYNQGPRHAAEKIDVARAAGLGGFLLFSYDSVAEWKGGRYLPSLKGKVMGSEALDRTAQGR